MGLQQSSRAYADLRQPSVWAFCDRCQFRYHHHDLQWQYDFRGNQLQNLRILVCRTCLDIPQDQLRVLIIGPDPYPVRDPRPGFQATEEGAQPPPLSFAVPSIDGKYLETDWGEVITDDQGNPIPIT